MESVNGERQLRVEVRERIVVPVLDKSCRQGLGLAGTEKN